MNESLQDHHDRIRKLENIIKELLARVEDLEAKEEQRDREDHDREIHLDYETGGC